MAHGLTSLVLSMLQVSKIILVVQASFFVYMISSNALRSLEYINLMLDQSLPETATFIKLSTATFVVNALWYI
jgi:hypothetical protein